MLSYKTAGPKIFLTGTVTYVSTIKCDITQSIKRTGGWIIFLSAIDEVDDFDAMWPYWTTDANETFMLHIMYNEMRLTGQL